MPTTAMTERGPAASRVPRLVSLALAGAFVGTAIAATWPIWDKVFAYALSREEQSHSLLALPIVAWLIWLRRDQVAAAVTRPSVWGALMIALGWFLAVAGFRTGIELAMNGGALLIIIGAALSALGTRVLGAVLPAVFALAMVLPVPGRVRTVVAAPLQDWSASITTGVIELFGLPVSQSGNVLTVNGVPVAIAEACSGMRMVTALAIIAYAFVFTLPLRPWARLLVLALSPVLALSVNIIRLIPTALFYGYASPRAALVFHDVSGWGVLLIALAMLAGTVRVLRWLELPVNASPLPAPVPPSSERSAQGGALTGIAALLIVAILLVPGGGFNAARPEGADAYFAAAKDAIDAIPYRLGGAVGVDEPISVGAEQLLHPNAMLSRRYTDPATNTSYTLVFVHCADARDLEGHYPPVCYPTHGWRPESQVETEFAVRGLRIPARLYGYSLPGALRDESVRIVSFFALPSSSQPLSANMEAVTRAARSAATARLGAAHIMICFPGDTDDGALTTTMTEILSGVAPAIAAVTRVKLRE
jgi:exosortase